MSKYADYVDAAQEAKCKRLWEQVGVHAFEITEGGGLRTSGVGSGIIYLTKAELWTLYQWLKEIME